MFPLAVALTVALEFALAGSFGRDPTIELAASRGVAIGGAMAVVFESFDADRDLAETARDEHDRIDSLGNNAGTYISLDRDDRQYM